MRTTKEIPTGECTKIISKCPRCGEKLVGDLKENSIVHEGTPCRDFESYASSDGRTSMLRIGGGGPITVEDFQAFLNRIHDAIDQDRIKALHSWARRQYRIAGLLAAALDVAKDSSPNDVERLLKIAGMYCEQLAVAPPRLDRVPPPDAG